MTSNFVTSHSQLHWGLLLELDMSLDCYMSNSMLQLLFLFDEESHVKHQMGGVFPS